MRRLYEPQGGLLDEALVLRFPAPHSASGETLIELHLHGAQQTVAAVLTALGRCEGLRPAVGGEFSWRALVYGKQDLLALEGLADLLAAESEAERKQATISAAGGLSALCRGLQNQVFALEAELEAHIEFGEDEFGVAPDGTANNTTNNQEAHKNLRAKILLLADACESLVEKSAQALRDKAAARVVFFGTPNVGKSSLFNALLGEARAIVTEEAGTTRDTLEARLMRRGKCFSLTDTAGVRTTLGRAEQEGVRRARHAIEETSQAGGVLLWVVDGAEVLRQGVSPCQELSKTLNLAQNNNGQIVILINKSDLFLPAHISPQEKTRFKKLLQSP